MVISAHTHEDLILKTKETMIKHDSLLKNLGMIVNIEKTELMIMHSRKKSQTSDTREIKIGGKSVKISDNMKILGITFDKKLDWKTHVAEVVKKSSIMMSGLQIIRGKLDRGTIPKSSHCAILWSH